jgi:hypothetical protein
MLDDEKNTIDLNESMENGKKTLTGSRAPHDRRPGKTVAPIFLVSAQILSLTDFDDRYDK